MTKDGHSKSKMLGRFIFGEKRKQQAAAKSSRHRSATRKGSNVADTKPPGGDDDGGAAATTPDKDPINIHDWAVWRMHLNEQMSCDMTDEMDFNQLRQFLQSNPFYQQHSRDPSNGRYNGVRLLFSIPHAKLPTEPIKSSPINLRETKVSDQNNVRPTADDRPVAVINSTSVGPPMVADKTISQLLPKNLTGNMGGFLHVNEQMIATDLGRTRRSIRAACTSTDRVHSTLQKAVKDGNVLEKIKAFEMQAAAVQAEMTPKLSCGNQTMNTRIPAVTSSMQSIAHRTLSPMLTRPTQYPISPLPVPHELQQQQYVRPHRSRHVHPVQHRRDGHLGPVIGRESRKGAHVLEPAHGDIILKRRTPSQKATNDEDYSMTVMSSMAVTASQNLPPRRHRQQHHRASASRSRHRQDAVHEKRSSSHHDHGQKKHVQKQKETTATSPSNKINSRYRWLMGRKENSTENGKKDPSTTKSSKTERNKKKADEKEKQKAKSPDPKGEAASTSDQIRVYDVPTTTSDDQTKAGHIPPQPPSRIDEENESDREENATESKTIYLQSKDEEKCETIPTIHVQRRASQLKARPKLHSIDGEIISKIEDDTRHSRPTDDHAHRSELLDEDDECRSEGDVFIEESSVGNLTQHQSNQSLVEGSSSDRRWQWSKESGGLIEKTSRKKKQQQLSAIVLITREHEDESVVYENPESEHASISKFEKNHSAPLILSNETKNDSLSLIKSKTLNEEQTNTDDFFDNGPYIYPEETLANITSTA